MHKLLTYRSVAIAAVCSLVLLPVIAIVAYGKYIFPIDDAYIYAKQAINFAHGQFLTYSISEPPTNSNTSLLFYLCASLFSFLFRNASFELFLNSYTIFVLVLNIFLAFFSVKCVCNICKTIYGKYYQHILAIILCCYPVLFQYISGLEGALTTFIILAQALSYLKKDKPMFLIFTALASINRPENIILNGYYALHGAIKAKRINAELVFVVVLAITVPLVNLVFTGSLSTASVARVGGISIHLKTIPNIFARLIFLPLLQAEYAPLASSKQLYVIAAWSFFAISLGVSLKARYMSVANWFRKLFRRPSNNSFKLAWPKLGQEVKQAALLAGAAASYVLIPATLSGTGEWARYIAPAFPMVVIALNAIPERTLRSLAPALIAAGIVATPAYWQSFCNCQIVMQQLILPVAQKINESTTPSDTVLIDQAGLLSLAAKGRVVDIYGLGTQRYTDRPGFPTLYEKIRKEHATYAAAWFSDTKRYYLDSAHYETIFGKEHLQLTMSSKIRLLGTIDFPNQMCLFKINQLSLSTYSPTRQP